MKFRSRKDLNSFIFFYSLILLLSIVVIQEIYFNGISLPGVLISGFILLLIGFVLWLYYGTKYEITSGFLKYKSGPISGKIEISRIREIIQGKSMWSGLKPATATKGLIIKYDKFEEIYISPDTNEEFVAEISKLNPEIKIVRIS